MGPMGALDSGKRRGDTRALAVAGLHSCSCFVAYSKNIKSTGRKEKLRGSRSKVWQGENWLTNPTMSLDSGLALT